jgi:hypothetical protein
VTPAIRSSEALAGVREPCVVTVSESALKPPPGLRLREVVPPEDVQGKGIAGLKLGPAPLAEPVQVARVYELRRG